MMGAPVEETTIVNRCAKEQTYEYRLEHGALPKSKSLRWTWIPLRFIPASEHDRWRVAWGPDSDARLPLKEAGSSTKDLSNTRRKTNVDFHQVRLLQRRLRPTGKR